MKKLILALLHFFLFLNSRLLYSENLFNFAFDFQYGIKHGSVNELVFKDDDYVSKLKWDQKTSPYFQNSIYLKYGDAYFSGSLSNSFPIKSGNMEDFDYLTGVKNEVSHYSNHIAYLDKDFKIKGNLLYCFNVNTKFKIFPKIGFSYQNKKWNAADGYLQYPAIDGLPWTGQEPKTTISGTVISYEQAIWYPFYGMSFTVNSSDKIILELGFLYSPFLSCDSLDNHFLRSVQFYDTMRNGLSMSLESKIYFKPSNNSEKGLFLSLEYNFLEVKGNTASREIGKSNDDFILNEEYKAGTKGSMLNIAIGVTSKHSFFK